jgi:ABC-2 type transport system ATP-binding protein
MAAVVDLDQVVKRYGRVDALAGVSLSVPAGQVVAILGPNGAGKTTAISLMIGLRRPTSGVARLFGLDPRNARARAGCGVMLQESGVPAMLEVRELIDLFRSYYPRPMDTSRVVAMAGLAGVERQQAGKLSGGQRQRLYFALAICGDPAVLFLDEPTVGLDVEARRGFWAHMRDFARSGRTIVLTTHYLEEADALAERVVVIDHGRIVTDGSPAAIKARAGGKRVSFATDGALEPAALVGLPLQRSEVDDGLVRLYTAEPERVLAELFRRGVAVRDLEVVGATLEEAIVRLTDETTAADG